MSDLAFPNLGNALVAGMRARQFSDEMDERQRRRDLAPDVQAAIGGDNQALGRVAAVDPDYAIKIGPMLDRLDANKRAIVKQAADFTVQAGMGLMNTPPELRSQAYQEARAEAQRRGIPTDTWPDEWGPRAEGFMTFNVGKARDVNKYLDHKNKMEEERANQPVPMPGFGGAPTQAPAGTPQSQDGDLVARRRAGIAGIESSGQPNGGYGAVGPVANPKGNRAYGKYQVMDFNVGPWTQEVLGRAMTPQEFLANPQAQEAVFDAKFNQYAQKYGEEGAAKAWFAGEGGMNNPGATDVNGMTVARYGQQFNRNLGPQVAQAPTTPPGQDFTAIQPGDARRSGGIVNVQGGSQPVIPQGGGEAPGMPGGEPQATQPDPRSLRSILPPGVVPLMHPKTRLPVYDAAGRLAVEFPNERDANGNPRRDYVEVPKAKAPGQTTGPFAGNGLDAQAYNIVLRGDPMSPEYAAAYAHLSTPRVQLDQQTGQAIQIRPDMSWATPPGQQRGSQAPGAASAPGAKSVTVEAVPGLPGRMNNEQARDAGFADRMTNSNQILDGVAQQGGSFWGRMKELAPGNSGNFLQSDEYQSFKQARDDFINAQLRRESGAAISKDEYDKADRQYFPIPGDSESTVSQKAKNRQLAVDAMVRGSGPAYKPGPNVPGQKPQTSGPADRARLQFDARRAIERGAPREAVMQELRDKYGIDSLGE